MRLVLIAAAFMAVMAFDVRPAPAHRMAPWCAVVSTGFENDSWDCHYASIEECRPNVIAGNRGFCSPNPAWRASSEPRKWRRHHRRIRRH